MKDFLLQLELLERQSAECELISNLAVDGDKREIFGALANDYRAMATTVRLALANLAPPSTAEN